MIPAKIESVSIRGFRSLADVHIEELPQAVVLIGANGSGKSNFIRFFEMLGWMLKDRRLGDFVATQGGADDQLFGGSKTTQQIEAEIHISTDRGRSDYRFTLAHAQPDRLVFSQEALRFVPDGRPAEADWHDLGKGHQEAKIVEMAQSERPGDADSRATANAEGQPARLMLQEAVQPIWPHDEDLAAAKTIVNLLGDCTVFRFHDTSDGSPLRRQCDVSDCNHLRPDGSNLAAVLYRLEHQDAKWFDLICWHTKRILPGFDRFVLEENHGKVSLGWKAHGTDKIFGAHLASGASLRFFVLITLLYLPAKTLPNIILLDKPALGLHPYAVDLVGSMIQSLSVDHQVIVSTQSPLLMDTFEHDQIIVSDLQDGRTTLQRFDPDKYRRFLENDHTPGDLWLRNLMGGNP